VLRQQALLDMARDFELALGFLALLVPIGLFFDGRQQSRIVPRLLDEIDSAAAHGFDGQIDARPCRHDHHRNPGVASQQLIEKIQTLIAGGRVARIVHVHQDQVEARAIGSGQGAARRIDGLGLMARAFQKQTDSFENIDLIVTHQHAHTPMVAFSGGEGQERVREAPKDYCISGA
jgi:hypothetical protein